jgi:hypothetical protein
MGRWLRVLLGPLPATVLLLPLLFAGGLGAAIALATGLLQPNRSPAERWAMVSTSGMILGWVAAAGVGVLALWLVTLAEEPATLRQSPIRWFLAAGLLIGLIAAARWLWVMGVGGHSYGTQTWVVWLGLLVGPIVLGSYYFIQLLRE